MKKWRWGVSIVVAVVCTISFLIGLPMLASGRLDGVIGGGFAVFGVAIGGTYLWILDCWRADNPVADKSSKERKE